MLSSSIHLREGGGARQGGMTDQYQSSVGQPSVRSGEGEREKKCRKGPDISPGGRNARPAAATSTKSHLSVSSFSLRRMRRRRRRRRRFSCRSAAAAGPLKKISWRRGRDDDMFGIPTHLFVVFNPCFLRHLELPPKPIVLSSFRKMIVAEKTGKSH